MMTIIYINFEYMILLIDKVFLKIFLFDIYIKKMKILIIIKNVKLTLYFINNYYLFNLYILKIFNLKKTIDYIQRKIYIVDNFKIKIFIKIDIFESKCIRIDIDD